MNVIVYSSLYRLPDETFGAPFTEQRVLALQRLARVTVVRPVPWCPNLALMRSKPQWASAIGVPKHCVIRGVDVHYPKYVMLPKISGLVQPALEVMGSMSLLRRLNNIRPIDVINARWVYPDGVAAVWIGKKLGIPVVLTACGCDINLYGNFRGRRPQITWALRNAAHVTAVSQPLAEAVIQLGATESRVSVEPPGVNLDKFRPRDPVDDKTTGSGDYLVVVGRLAEEKGISVLIEALQLLDQKGSLSFDTVIVGDGPLRGILEEQIIRSGLSTRVRFIGAVEHDKVQTWVKNARALCLPSLREGMPNVVLEALASGVPVVASHVGGVPNIVNEKNGLMVEPQSPERLAEALDATFRRTWNPLAVRASVSHLSWANWASAISRILDGVRVSADGLRASRTRTN